MGLSSLQDLPYSQHNEGHHVETVQPHDVAALHEAVIHPGIGQGQDGRRDLFQPSLEPGLQIPAHGKGREGELDGHGNVEIVLQMIFIEEEQKEVHRRRQIVGWTCCRRCCSSPRRSP